MLFVGLLTLAVDLFFSVLSLVPLPAFSGFTHFNDSIESFLSIVPNAIAVATSLLGPGVMSVFSFMLSLYLLALDFFLAMLGWKLLVQVFNFIKGFFPG